MSSILNADAHQGSSYHPSVNQVKCENMDVQFFLEPMSPFEIDTYVSSPYWKFKFNWVPKLNGASECHQEIKEIHVPNAIALQYPQSFHRLSSQIENQIEMFLFKSSLTPV